VSKKPKDRKKEGCLKSIETINDLDRLKELMQKARHGKQSPLRRLTKAEKIEFGRLIRKYRSEE
jgi:hypothetical protein